MKKEKQSWTDYVPHSVSLYYVDYRENLDSHDDLQEQCIRRNSLSPLEEQILEWYADQEHGNLQGYLSEIRNEMEADGKSAEYIRHEEKIKRPALRTEQYRSGRRTDRQFRCNQYVLLPWSRNRGLCVWGLWARRIRNGLSS